MSPTLYRWLCDLQYTGGGNVSWVQSVETMVSLGRLLLLPLLLFAVCKRSSTTKSLTNFLGSPLSHNITFSGSSPRNFWNMSRCIVSSVWQLLCTTVHVDRSTIELQANISGGWDKLRCSFSRCCWESGRFGLEAGSWPMQRWANAEELVDAISCSTWMALRTWKLGDSVTTVSDSGFKVRRGETPILWQLNIQKKFITYFERRERYLELIWCKPSFLKNSFSKREIPSRPPFSSGNFFVKIFTRSTKKFLST